MADADNQMEPLSKPQYIRFWKVTIYFGVVRENMSFEFNEISFNEVMRNMANITYDFEPTKIEITAWEEFKK